MIARLEQMGERHLERLLDLGRIDRQGNSGRTNATTGVTRKPLMTR
jgi:hypothetical protein